MTRQLDTGIKAGQRKPILEIISKLPIRGTEEDKSWSCNKGPRASAEVFTQCIMGSVYEAVWCEKNPGVLTEQTREHLCLSF